MPTETRVRRSPRPAGWLAALLLALATPAWAQSSPWYLSTAVTVSHDDNLLRLSEGETAPPDLSQADTVTSTSLVGGLDQRLGLQRLRASLSVRNNRFAQNMRYDNESYNGSASLDWTASRRISGQISAGVSQQLSTFSSELTALVSEKNLERGDTAGLSLTLSTLGAWQLELAMQKRRARNTLDRDDVRARNLDQDDQAATLAWKPLGPVQTSLGVRVAEVVYPDFPTGPTGSDRDRYRSSQLFATARWQASAASVLETRISSSGLRYANSSDRDFDSASGSLLWRWQATARFALVSRLSRDRGQDSYPVLRRTVFGELRLIFADQRDTDSAGASIEWMPGARLNVSAGYQLGRRTVTRRTLLASDGFLFGEATGRDDSRYLTLAARWEPRRWMQTGCDLRDDVRRGDGVVNGNLDSRNLSCYLQFTMQ